MVADYHEPPPSPLTRYVVGFAFDTKKRHVVLVEKQRPAWQKGQLNGLGGHCEMVNGTLETGVEAMGREFGEECGVKGLLWHPFATLYGNAVRSGRPREKFIVEFLRAFDDDIFKARSVTDEVIHIFNLESWAAAPVIPNLRWLVPMALSFDRGEVCSYFTIQEMYPPSVSTNDVSST